MMHVCMAKILQWFKRNIEHHDSTCYRSMCRYLSPIKEVAGT